MKDFFAPELLAPAGNMEKLLTALHFGADAVYLAGKNFGLRAFSENFTEQEMAAACKTAHEKGKKVYVTINIFASNGDLAALPGYISSVYAAGADAVLVSDPGVFSIVQKTEPDLPIHISTQANVTNKQAALFWAEHGAKRIVLARELPLQDIAEIAQAVKGKAEIEIFVHGAMCISMSGRCLLSNYLSNRDANRGECVQACRWQYEIRETGRGGAPLTMQEDARGTYIMNSKDLNLLPYLKEITAAGVASLKIEGRMKSPYYAGTVVNVYRRALDALTKNPDAQTDELLMRELEMTSHRQYTNGFLLGGEAGQCYETSKPAQTAEFAATVIGSDGKYITIEQRNRFRTGDTLQVVSPDGNFLKEIKIDAMFDRNDQPVEDAKLVQQILKIPCGLQLNRFDILRQLQK